MAVLDGRINCAGNRMPHLVEGNGSLVQKIEGLVQEKSMISRGQLSADLPLARMVNNQLVVAIVQTPKLENASPTEKAEAMAFLGSPLIPTNTRVFPGLVLETRQFVLRLEASVRHNKHISFGRALAIEQPKEIPRFRDLRAPNCAER